MADFKLGRLKFVWKGGWTTANTYVKDDIVEYNGQGWVCEVPHTSAGFPADRDSGKWTKIAEGFSWNGAWDSGTTYQENAVVSYLSSTWISITDNNTNNPPLVLPATVDSNWQLYAAGFDLSYVDQDIIPSANDSYNLGSTTLRFKDGYFSGNLDVTGDITLGGNLTIGNQAVDTVTVQADFTSDLIPNASNSFDLGSTAQRWDNLYINKINDLSFDKVEGNTYYVTQDGNDLDPGTSIQGAFATIKKALTVAVAGDAVKVSAGTFEEIFPLTVPQGVAIVGTGIRATKIVPTEATNDLDCFLLNGETGVADLTVSGMFYNNVNDTGYAFRYAPGCVITTRSPYMERVTVLNRGSITSAGDPYGFAQGDAGRGALIDGAQVSRSSLEAAMLFNECTFIVPNSRALIMTNGARSEWLTCFTYFADLAIEGVSGTTGRGGDGKTLIEFGGVSGAGFTVGETIRITSTDASSVFNLTVDSADGSAVYVDGKVDVLAGEDFTPGTGGSIVGLSSGTSATSITRYDRGEFAAELRAIAGANIYGNQAIKADGDDVVLQLMAWNFAYIGTGADLTNDNTAVIQANEVIEVNGGRVFYNSVDQGGNFRVGDLFTVDFATGNVTFQAPEFNVSSVTGINFTDGINSTVIDPTQVSTGNIIISGNAISSATGEITLDPGGSEVVNINASTNITGDLDVTGDVTIGGNITIGNQTLDTVTVVADFTSNLTPDVADTYDLGAIDKAWRTVFAQAIEVTGTGYVKLPVGTVAQRPSGRDGMIRYNSELSSFEGYANANWQGLGGVKSVDGFTFIVPETSPAASNGELEFYAENTAGTGTVKVAGLNKDRLTVPIATASTTSTNGALVVTGGVGIGGVVNIGSNLNVTADVAVNGGDLTTNQTTFNVLPTTATTVNAFGAATTVAIGATTGTTTVRNNLTVTGDFTVNGTTTTVNSTTLSVDDKNIELASIANPTDITADGAGITIKGATDKTFNWVSATSSFTANQNIDVLAGNALKVAGVDKVTATALFPNGDVTIGSVLSTVTINDEILVTNNLITNGDVISDNIIQNLYPNQVTTLNIGGEATTVNLGATSSVGTTTVRNNLDVVGPLRIQSNTIATKPSTLVYSATIGNSANALQSGFTTTTDGMDAQVEIEVERETGALVRVTLLSGGKGWVANATPFVGDLLYIRGGEYGGIDGNPIGTLPVAGNDIILAVTAVNTPKVVIGGVPNDNTGVITAFEFVGTPPVLSDGITTFSLLENFIETVDFATSATTITMGAVNNLGQADGTTTIRNNAQINGDLTVNGVFTGAAGNITTNAIQLNAFNDTAVIVNAFGAASTISIGSLFGQTTINNTLEVPSGIIADIKGSVFGDFSSKIIDGITGDITANDLQVNGSATFEFDVLVKGGDLLTDQTTFNLVNDTATTVNFAGAATTVVVGDTVGTIQLRNEIVQVDGNLTVNGGEITTGASVFDFVTSGATTVNIASSADTVGIGSSLGSTTINNDIVAKLNVIVEGDTLDTSNTTFNLVNDTATTVNFAGAATILTVGDATGTVNFAGTMVNFNGDVTVKGGDLETDQTTFNLLTTPATVNFADAATALTIGAGSGTTNIRNNLDVDGDLTVAGGDIATSAVSFNLLNNTVTTLNLAGAATQVNIGSTNGATNIRHDLNVDGKITVGTAVGGIATIDSADTSFYLANITAENLYMGGAATVVEIGSTTGTTSINNALAVDGQATFEQDIQLKGGDLTTNQTTFNLINTVAETMNFAGAGTLVNIGSATGTTVVRNNLQVNSDIEIRGGDLTTNQATFNLINTNATTVNFAGGANTVNVAAPGSETNIVGNLNIAGLTTVSNHIIPSANVTYDLGSSTNRFRDLYLSGGTIDLAGGTISYDGTSFNFQGGTNVGQSVETESTSFDLLNNIAQIINFGGDAVTINMGGLSGSTNIRHNLNVAGNITVGSSDSSVSTLDVTDTTFFLANTTAETIFFGNAATSINMGSVGGLTTINTGLTVTGNTILEENLTVNGNLTLTSLNTSGEDNDFVISPQGTGRVIIEPQGGLILNPTTVGNMNNVNIGSAVRGTGRFTSLAANSQALFSAGISSVDSTTGSVVVQGGVGIGENLNVEGNLSANQLTLRGTVLFENELAVASGGTGAGQFTARGILYGNSTDPIQSTAASDYETPYTGTNQQTSNAILTTTAAGVPVWTDVIDCGTF